jgi:hypothetical protein
VGDEKGTPGRIRRVQGQPAVTPDMLWPAPKKMRTEGEERPVRARHTDSPSVRARRSGHPSTWNRRVDDPNVRARAIDRPGVVVPFPEPRVILRDGHDLVDLSDCGQRCGSGVWCEACRADIRAEAMLWLRELNVVRPPGAGEALSWSRAWHHEVLLADH